MGDYFVTITDVEATADEAEALAERVVKWLIEQGIILREKADCVLSGEPTGYPPGPNVAQAVEHPEHVSWRGQAGGNCGLEVITERHVQWTTQPEAWCPHCHYTIQTDAFYAAVDEWYKGGAGLLRCPQCGQSESVTEYEQGDFPWGFGNLAFQFWNWTILKPEFIEDITRLFGHKVVVSADKL